MSILMQEWPRRHRITIEHYYRMAEAGLFAPDARVELIEGEIVDMPPMGSRHAGKSARLADLLVGALAGRASVRQQLPVSLGSDTEPQPDLAVVKLRADYYESAHPTAEEVLLIVEISDATLRYDREVKGPLYARHAIPELWIVDLQNEQIHFHRAPVRGQYALVTSTAGPGVTPIAALPGAAVDLSEVVP